MTTPFNEEQKKRVAMIATATAFAGFAIGLVLAMRMGRKQLDKLEAKIFKLEGWQ